MDVHLPPSGRHHSVGTRVCLLVAGLFVIAGAYLLVLPLERVAAEGPPFDCGTALAPAAGDFARSVCGDLNQRQRLQGGAVLLGALLLAGGGRVAFGPVRRRRGDESWTPPAPATPEWSRPAGRPALPQRKPRSDRDDEDALARAAGRDPDRT